MDNTNTNLEDAIKELGVPPVPPMPPVGSVPTDAEDVSPADAMAAELANPAPEPIAPPAPADDAMATLDALVADAPAPEAPADALAADATVPPIDAPAETPAETAPVSDLDEVKKNMLKDLFPLMDKVSVTAEQRFRIYREMIEDTGDKSLIAAAYEAAKGISDDVIKGEALLFLVESADK